MLFRLDQHGKSPCLDRSLNYLATDGKALSSSVCQSAGLLFLIVCPGAFSSLPPNTLHTTYPNYNYIFPRLAIFPLHYSGSIMPNNSHPDYITRGLEKHRHLLKQDLLFKMTAKNTLEAAETINLRKAFSDKPIEK